MTEMLWEADITLANVPVMKVRQKISKRLIAVLAILLVAGVTVTAFCNARQKHLVVMLLRLETSPSSLRNVDCESWGWSDVLTTCAFEIDPVEFPRLLSGWQLVEAPVKGSNYSFSSGPKVGREFTVVAEYSITDPKDFTHGGRISLVTDKSRTRWQLDYYEE